MKKLFYILLSFFLANYFSLEVLISEDNNLCFKLNFSEIQTNKEFQKSDYPQSIDGIDFGFIEVGNSDIKNIFVTNNGNNQFEISSVNIQGSEGTAFNVITQYTYPKIFGPGEKVKYEIQFSPTFPKNYYDTLLIIIAYPVKFVYKIPLSGASIIENMIWLPDTVALIGIDEFKLPIKVQNTNKDIFISGLQYRLVLSFNSEIFFPIGITKGKIESNEVVNGKRIMVITDENVSLFGNEQVLTEIIGYVLLGNNSASIINIQEITWNKDWIRPNSKNGELRTYGLCGNTISMIKWKEDTDIKVHPNPASQKINFEIRTNENSSLLLQIFSSTGNLCYSEIISINNPNNENIEENFIVNIDKLFSGFYYIMISNQKSRYVQPLSIIK